MATKAAPKAGAQAEAKPASSKLLVIVLALVILLGGGAGAWYFMTQQGANAGTAKPVVAGPPVFLPMEAFTVNLQAENGEQFLQTSFTLQVLDQAQIDLLKLYMPHVRSRILLLLSSKKPSEIMTIEGKQKLSEEILTVFKQPLTPQAPLIRVNDVLFTSFVVQ